MGKTALCIVHVFSTPFPPTDGIAIHVYDLARRLLHRGNIPVLITRGGSKLSEQEVDDAGITILRPKFFRCQPFHVHVHGYYLARLLDKLSPRPDIVHFHSPLVPPIKLSIPTVATFHSALRFDTAHAKAHFLRGTAVRIMGRTISYHLESSLIRRVDQLIAVSESVKNELTRAYPVEGRSIEVVPSCIDTDFFSLPSGKREPWRIVYVGRLAYSKGVHDLIDIFAQLGTEYPNLMLTLVGDGPLRSDLERYVHQRGITGRVEFIGQVTSRETVRSWFQRAGLVVIPSHYESGPITLLEAMSCGAPLVCTKVGLAPKLLQSGKNGMLVDPGNTGDMLNAVRSLLNNFSLRENLGVAARQTVVSFVDRDQNTDDILNVYNRAIAQNRRDFSSE